MPSAKQAVSFQIFYSGSWHEISSSVFVQEEISTLWGQGSEGAALRPGSIKLTLNNAAGAYDPSNPMSPLYGVAGRNTTVALLLDGSILMTAEATSWSPGQTLDFRTTPARGRATVDLEANGVLQRIGQSSAMLGSALTRFDRLYLSTLTGSFPLEDGRNTTSPTSLVPGTKASGIAGTFANAVGPGIDFGEGDGPPGSDPVVKIQSGGHTGFQFTFRSTASTTAGWAVSWVMKLDAPIPTTTTDFDMFEMQINTVGGMGIFVGLDQTGLRMFASDGVNAPVFNVSNPFPTDWTQWQLCQVTSTLSGGTTTVEIDVFTIGSSSIGFLSGSYTGNPGRVDRAYFVQQFEWDGSVNLCIGHVVAIEGHTDDLMSGNRLVAFAGHTGETVGARFLRILGEEGFSATVKGTASTTQTMGAFENSTLIDFLELCETTEDGLVYDNSQALGLVLRTRRNRYNQTPLVLTYPGHISEPFDKIIDDLGTHNRVVVNNVTGAEATRELTTGSMSSQDPPNGVSLASQSIDVSVSNEGTALPALAAWWLNRGTLPNPRFPAVNIDLVANPSLKAPVSALTIGDLVVINGYPFDSLSLMVIGIANKIGSHSRMVTLTTVPADLFLTGVYDGTVRRYDSASTTLATAKTATATSWDIKTANFGDVWSTSSIYQWMVAGELMTVTGMTSPVLSGGFWTQTGTVIRSANGVVKTQAAGASIRVANPGRYAL